MRPGYNPARRNRNIGTARQGHGQDNRLTIPNPAWPYWTVEQIGAHSIETRNIAGRDMAFIVEQCRPDCVHPCSIADVAHLLEAIPASDWAGIAAILFRQPTRKQMQLDPAWGRLRYHADIISPPGPPVLAGPVIFLEAVPREYRIKWGNALDPDDRAELDRLREDGHEVTPTGGGYLVEVTPESARNTQLYRTLPHEIGHWFDWSEKVRTPKARGGDYIELSDAYFARPKAEREAFAHRYADRVSAELRRAGAIPFAPRQD